jgi:hypothetical protein
MVGVVGLEGGRPGTRPTDGKIKAPTAIERMWLVVQDFSAISRQRAAGSFGNFASNFNAPTAIHHRPSPRRRDRRACQGAAVRTGRIQRGNCGAKRQKSVGAKEKGCEESWAIG